METAVINTNAMTTVKLTRSGTKAYNTFVSERNEMLPRDTQRRSVRPGAQITEPLWQIMQIFGDKFSMGGEALFEDNVVHIVVSGAQHVENDDTCEHDSDMPCYANLRALADAFERNTDVRLNAVTGDLTAAVGDDVEIALRRIPNFKLRDSKRTTPDDVWYKGKYAGVKFHIHTTLDNETTLTLRGRSITHHAPSKGDDE